MLGGHRASKWQSQDSNQGTLAAEPVGGTTTPWCLGAVLQGVGRKDSRGMDGPSHRRKWLCVNSLVDLVKELELYLLKRFENPRRSVLF